MAHKTWAIHYTTEHVELVRTTTDEGVTAAICKFYKNHEGDLAKIANVTAHHVNTVDD